MALVATLAVLPSLLVLRSILGVKKTLVFMLLVIVMSSLTGWIYGFIST